jgi:hypothetical protein
VAVIVDEFHNICGLSEKKHIHFKKDYEYSKQRNYKTKPKRFKIKENKNNARKIKIMQGNENFLEMRSEKSLKYFNLRIMNLNLDSYRYPMSI